MQVVDDGEKVFCYAMMTGVWREVCWLGTGGIDAEATVCEVDLTCSVLRA